MSKAIKMVDVRFNETSVLEGGRVYAYGEEGVITEAEAKRVGSSVEVLGEARDMFQPDAGELLSLSQSLKKLQRNRPLSPLKTRWDRRSREEVSHHPRQKKK